VADHGVVVATTEQGSEAGHADAEHEVEPVVGRVDGTTLAADSLPTARP
jgi:hypothetical protein